MVKIIFTSRYIRDAPPTQLENYVRYIGTREGVEKLEESRLQLAATIQQKKFIQQLIHDIPQAKQMLEYMDFLSQPTIGNASEFISCALEQNLDVLTKRENYVDYIANRPRVERIGEHGLFSDAGKQIVLKQVQDEVVNHKGVVWTHVVSLRREDAVRLGYDSAKDWMALLRSKRAMLCKYMKISSANLRWYAAFHNEGHHPHVHIMVYSAKDNDGYLTKESISAMRSELAHTIFRQDFAHIYNEQNQARGNLKSGAENVMKQMMNEICSGTIASKTIEEKILRLSKRLKNTGGKKVYGYLKRDVKNLIDEIVDELAKDSRVNKLYQEWGKWQDEILLTCQNQTPSLPPLSQQPQFKSIKNMIIQEALNLANGTFTFDDELVSLPESSSEDMIPDTITETETVTERSELLTEKTSYGESNDFQWWSEQYKLARQYLYGSDEVEQDFTEALRLLKEEAENGNGFAMHDIGRIYADGLGCEIDLELSYEWYSKALNQFKSAEQAVKEKQRPYLWYRIGKMYSAGLGTEQNYQSAAEWFSKAVAANHKYAQYSLAGLYYNGHGVEQDYAKALELYQRSAKQKNPYADYELAKMYRDGIRTTVQPEESERSFRNAFSGFRSLESQSHDDKLQYRLGQMLHTGTGIEKDDKAAIQYWEKSAKLGNVHAQYSLAKLWLENGNENVNKTLKWLQKASDGGHAMAQYALGKFYLNGTAVEKDVSYVARLFLLSAEQNNEYAAYQLGKLYLTGDGIQKDIDSSVKWLKYSAEQRNQFAMYTLGKLYLLGEDVPQNIEKAVYYLKLSAEQNNEYAAYQLGKLYLTGELVSKDVETALYYLELSASQENQYAQYALGKLYLLGKDVPQDKEKAVQYLTASASQGNLYAKFLIEHLDKFHEPSAFLVATRLLHRLENLFREDYRKANGGSAYHIDRKRRRKLAEKKQAQGHKQDDHEPMQQLY